MARGWGAELAAIAQAKQRRDNAKQQVRQMPNPQAVARNASQLRRAWPHLAPGLIYPLAASGIKPDNDTVIQLANADYKRRLAAGRLANPGEPDDLSMATQAIQAARQQRNQAQQGVNRAMQGGPDLGAIANTAADVIGGPISAGKAALEGKSLGEIATSAIPGYNLTTHVGLPAVNQAATAAGVDQYVKPVTRTLALAADTPIQYVNATLRSAAGGQGLIGQLTGEPQEGPIEGFKKLALQTQGGQAAAAALAGRKVDVGSGYLPDSASATGKAAAVAAREASPYLIGGHAWTPGRYVANEMPLGGPDSTAYKTVSGLVDAGVTLAADPVNLAFGAVTRAREAAKVVQPLNAADEAYRPIFEARSAVDRTAQAATKAERVARSGAPEDLFAHAQATAAHEVAVATHAETLTDAKFAAGAYSTGRFDTLSRKTFPQWAQGQGSGIIDHLTAGAEDVAQARQSLVGAAEEDLPRLTTHVHATEDRVFADLYKRMGTNKAPAEFYQDLLNAGDRNGVLSTMDSYLGTDIAEYPATRKFRPNYKPVFGESRWNSLMPRGRKTVSATTGDIIEQAPSIFPDDKDLSLLNADRWLHGVNATPDERAAALGHFLRAETPEQWKEAMGHMMTIAEDRVVATPGALYSTPTNRELAKAVTRWSQYADVDTKFGIDAVTGENLAHPGMVLDGDGIPLGSPMLESEMLASHMPLPDMRVLRKMTTPIANMAAKLQGRAMSVLDEAAAKSDQANILARDGDTAGAAALRREVKGLRADARRYNFFARGKGAMDYVVGGKLNFSDLTEVERSITARGTDLWRTTHLILKPSTGLRITAEGQARLWLYGLPNLFSDPVTVISTAIGARQGSTLGKILTHLGGLEVTADDNIAQSMFKRLGNQIEDWLPRHAVGPKGVPPVDEIAYADALQGNAGALIGHGDPTSIGRRTQQIKGWTDASYHADPEKALQGIADEAIRLRNDPITRKVLEASDPGAAKTWLTTTEDGARLAEHQFPRDSYQYISDTATEPIRVADMTPDQYRQMLEFQVDAIYSRTKGLSSMDPEILDAIRTGQLRGVPVRSDSRPALANAFRDKAVEGWTPPAKVRVPRFEPLGNGGNIGTGKEWVDRLLYTTMGRMENYANRSTTFRIAEWERTTELAGTYTPEAKIALLKNADIAGVPTRVREAIARSVTLAAKEGGLTLDEVSTLASAHALQTVRDVLFDLSERHQGWDMLRVVAPFGEAFQEVTQKWVQGITKNMFALRRGAQIYTHGKDAGFFQQSPYGEVFTYPGSEFITDKLLGVPVGIQGSVSGLNMVGNGLPGLGPAVQIPTAYLMKEFANGPKWDTIRNLVFPYGDDTTGGPIEDVKNALIPKWAQYFERGAAADQGDKVFGNTVGYMMNYLASEGGYQLYGDKAVEEADRLLKDSTTAAQKFMFFRGAASTVLPSAPIPKWLIRDPNNRLAELNVVRAKYYKVADKQGSTAAFQWLLDNFGAKNFLVAQGFSATASVLPRTSDQWAYVRDHPWLQDLYPNTFGMFTPPSKGGTDITAYQQSAEFRDQLTPTQRVQLANDRLGRFLHDKYAAQLDTTKPAEAEKLRQIDAVLVKEYVGYNTVATDQNRTLRRITELERAATDPRVEETNPGMAQALRDYMAFRSKANDIALARYKTSTGWQQRKVATDIRDWLRKGAATIIASHPEFRGPWDDVFRYEMNQDAGT